MDKIQTLNILDVPFDCLDCSQVLQHFSSWYNDGRCRAISFVNPHSVMVSHRDPDMAEALRHSSLILSDGIGIVIASRMLGCSQIRRITGPAFMLKFCEWSQYYGYRHYFYGGASGVAEILSRQLREKYPRLQIAGTYCPSFGELTPNEEEQIIADINACKPDIVWVGLGAPKQEKWIQRHLGKIQASAMIGVGAAFDFHSGQKKWAPQWIRDWGIEWIFRLIQEPARMWRRNLNNLIFLCCVVGQRMRLCYRGPAVSLRQADVQAEPDLWTQLAGQDSDVSSSRRTPEPVAISKEDSV